MSWQFFFILYLAFSVGLTLSRRKLAITNTVPASIVTAISYTFAVMPLGIVVGLSMDHHVTWSAWLIALLIIEGALIGTFNWMALIAMKHLPAAHFQTIFQLNALIIIALGWTLLGETLSALQIVGGVLILASGLLAIWAPVGSGNTRKRKPAEIKRGIILTLIGTTIMGLGLVAEKAALGHMDAGAYFIYGFATQCIAVVIIAIPQLKISTLRLLAKKRVADATLVGVIGVGVGFTYIAALVKSDNISLINSLKAFALPLTALAAHYVLKEHDDNRALWAAIALGVVGLVLVAL